MRKTILTVLVVVLTAIFSLSVGATSFKPARCLELSYTATNTKFDAEWAKNENFWFTNICAQSTDVTVILHDADGNRLLVREVHLDDLWASGGFTLRDLMIAAGFPDDMHTEDLFVRICADSQTLIGDSFHSNWTTFSGGQMFSPRGECTFTCSNFGVKWIEFERVSTSLIINQSRFFGRREVEITARDEQGNVVDQFNLSDRVGDYPVTGSYSHDDLGLPEDLHFGSLEVECHGGCYVGVELCSADGDRCEETLAWAVCCPGPPVVPRCELLKLTVLSGSVECLVGEYCEIIFDLDGSELIQMVSHNLPDGLSIEEVDAEENTWKIFGIPTEEGLGTAVFKNDCSNVKVRVSVTEEPVPPCNDPFAAVTKGSTNCTVSELCEFEVEVTSGTPPFGYDDSNLPAGLVAMQTGETIFSVSGTPTEAGEGNLTVTNSCNEYVVPITVEEGEIPPAGEGCTPGYWRNHHDSWVTYGPENDFDIVFGRDVFDPDITLGEAVELGGGDLNALARHAVAALLSASNSSVDYPYSVGEVKAMFQAAFDSGEYEATKNLFDIANNLGCPLN